MVTVWKLKGRITEDGKLDITLPAYVRAGDVEVDVRLLEDIEVVHEDVSAAKKNKQIADMVRAMGRGESWVSSDDPVDFVLKQRKEDEEQRGLDW